MWAAVTEYHRLEAYKLQEFISQFLEAGNLRSGCQCGWLLVRNLPGSRLPTPLLSSHGGSRERLKESSLLPLVRALIPFMRASVALPHLILILSQRTPLLIAHGGG